MKSLAQLAEIRETVKKDIAIRMQDKSLSSNKYKRHVLVCGGTGCTSSGSVTIREVFERELNASGIANDVKIVQTGCFGLCALGPVVIVYPEGTFYSQVTPEDVPEIVSSHLVNGELVQRLVYDDIGGGKKAEGPDQNRYKSKLRFTIFANAAFFCLSDDNVPILEKKK